MSEVQTIAGLFGDETQRWVVEVTLATKQAPTEQQLDAMADQADKHEMTVAARAHEPGVVFTAEVSGSEVEGVSGWAFDIAEDTTDYELADLRVSNPAVREAEAFRADTPELLAATDVAELLGVTRQRVHQLHTTRADFPAPYVRLGSGPVWTRPAIEAFNTGWDRKSGRPGNDTTTSGRPPIKAGDGRAVRRGQRSVKLGRTKPGNPAKDETDAGTVK